MDIYTEEYESYVTDMLEFVIFDIRRKVGEEMLVCKGTDSTVDALTLVENDY
jgi:hypothetical protein